MNCKLNSKARTNGHNISSTTTICILKRLSSHNNLQLTHSSWNLWFWETVATKDDISAKFTWNQMEIVRGPHSPFMLIYWTVRVVLTRSSNTILTAVLTSDILTSKTVFNTANDYFEFHTFKLSKQFSAHTFVLGPNIASKRIRIYVFKNWFIADATATVYSFFKIAKLFLES
ncbi:hypothetical protein L596_026389 [Steinernema carpocapsae]|uniref:Uncharacterized protein n=1 Tax=Steinernema carpocapsae TaxID=34508 RepID=A0A4U5M275_STECR|nr:hypothetical protein L596_026389 [Steinernema carpocapsae]